MATYGLGGGYRQGTKKSKNSLTGEASKQSDTPMGEGAGEGLYARPAGVYEVTSATTRFIPASSTRQLLIGVVVGFLIKGCLIQSGKIKRFPKS